MYICYVFLCPYFHKTILQYSIDLERLKQSKIASTTGKMFPNTLFSFCCHSLFHSCLKNPIPNIEFSFHYLTFQSKPALPFFAAFFFHVYSKKTLFFDSKHFHGNRFSFHGINVQFPTSDFTLGLIENCKIVHECSL